MEINLDKIEAAPAGRPLKSEYTYPYILPLPILGFGTGDIEALSSYICRQAESISESAHPYTTRMQLSILSKENENQSVPSSSYKDYYACNGKGKLQERFSQAITQSTNGAIKAELMTLKPFEFLTDRLSHGLIRDKMHWCPECWKEDLENDRQPYLRLYWTLQQTHICVKHKRRLLNQCPTCGAEQHQFPTFPRQHICDRCGHNLYETTRKQESLAESFTSEESWFSNAVYRLIKKFSSGHHHVSTKTVSRAFKRILNTTNLDVQEFAKKVHLTPRVVNGILDQSRRLYFPSFLDMCYRMDIPPDQFLFERDNLTDTENWRTHTQTEFVHMKKLSPRKLRVIYEEIEKALNSNIQPPPRLTHIASKHGTLASTVRYNFPKEAKALSKKYREWELKTKKDSYQALFERVTEGIFSLVRIGVYPSERKLKDLGYVKKNDLFREDVRHLLNTYQEIYKSHGFLDD